MLLSSEKINFSPSQGICPAEKNVTLPESSSNASTLPIKMQIRKKSEFNCTII